MEAHPFGTPGASVFILVHITVVVFLVVFVVPTVISKMTGWEQLAQRFPVEGTFQGLTWRFQSAQMRYGGNYNNCLTVGANTEGLYIKGPVIMVRHAPIFVPWREISASRRTFLFWKTVRLQLGRENPIPFTIRDKLAERLRQAAGNRWPIESVQ